MKLDTYSYRFALEIIQHPNYKHAWDEIETIIRSTPLFVFPGKSKAKEGLDVVQQMLNTYYDRKFAVENKWEFHPLATEIAESNLAADFYKEFGDLAIQSEVQFGNMARWYSDIFKFQTAYSQGKINFALSIVPKYELAVRIDQNIVNFERTLRELPSAKLSITLPILLLGLYPDENTPIVDLSLCDFPTREEITANSSKAKLNRFRIVNGYLNGMPLEEINERSPTGPIPK
ncbi:hypothetical protein JW887_06080 [Candidatus Dojkabacteria bacterium]|nr:hypothetical protein [Candidatus Dojkabacteria bacterium]